MFGRKMGLVWNGFLFCLMGGVVYGLMDLGNMSQRSYKLDEHPEMQKLIDEIADKNDGKIARIKKERENLESIRL